MGGAYSVEAPGSDTVYIHDQSFLAPPLLLNVDFVPQNYSLTSFKTGLAATGQTPADFWNALSCPGQYSATLPNLRSADHSVTTVAMTVNNAPGAWGLSSPDPMYDGYMYPGYGQNGTVALNNLPPGTYDLYLYGYDGNYDLAVGSTSYGNRRNRDWPLMNPLVWTEGRQYSCFRGVTVTAGQQLTVTMRPGQDGCGVLSGLQLATVLQPPTITTQPASQTVSATVNVTFSVGASGSAPLSYQWFHAGGQIPGATGASLTLNNIKLSDGGDYKVIVSNRGGSTTSSPATLTVNQVATPTLSPVGGSFPSAQNVLVTCSTPGATIRYTTDGRFPNETDPAVGSGGIVVVNQSLTLNVKAWKISPYTPSEVESESYRIEATPSDQPPTVTISPPTGISIPASDDVEILVEASDPDGSISKVQLLRDGLKIAESASSPLRYTLGKAAAGTYTFVARAIDNAGFVGVASPVTITVVGSGPVVSLYGAQPFFTSSPGSLIGSVLGVDPGSITSLKLNGIPMPVATGTFTLNPTLTEGDNTFTLVATDNQGRSAQATATVALDSIHPTIAITSPANNASFGTTRINVSGSFTEASLKRITVNGVLAFVKGPTFEALNVPLAVGENPIIAEAEDIAGNTAIASINVTGTDAGGGLFDPIQLVANPVGGFAPLSVSLQNLGQIPASIQQVLYDFDGDGSTDQTATDLAPITHTYSAPGEYFPVVTVVTAQGRFSSLGGWKGDSSRLRINVQAPPVQVGAAISVTDPVDLKWMPGGFLYVLSRSTSTITEYDTSGSGPAAIRSLSELGSNPTGLDVDSLGNVYVAISGDNQIAKFSPTTSSFQLDKSFGNAGKIGRSDGGAGTADGEFDAPYDVAISPDGEILVSDSANNRIQRFTFDGALIDIFGEQGSGFGDLDTPKGLAYDGAGYLYVVDSGNNRIALVLSSECSGTSGTAGDTLGQFRAPMNVASGPHGIYIADTGNNRIQEFEPFRGGHAVPLTPLIVRAAPATETGLSRPAAVAAVTDYQEEKLYIADTGNNRVILVRIPTESPATVWASMKQQLTDGNAAAAAAFFASSTSLSRNDSD